MDLRGVDYFLWSIHGVLPLTLICWPAKPLTAGAQGRDGAYAYSVDLVTDSHASISFPNEFNLSRTNLNASLPSSRCIGGSLFSTAFKIARAALAGSPACWPLFSSRARRMGSKSKS